LFILRDGVAFLTDEFLLINNKTSVINISTSTSAQYLWIIPAVITSQLGLSRGIVLIILNILVGIGCLSCRSFIIYFAVFCPAVPRINPSTTVRVANFYID